MRKLLTVAMMVGLAVVGLASMAGAAGWSIDVTGGASVPTGDFGDKNLIDAQTGFQIGGGADYMLNDSWALGVDGSWNKNKHGAEGKTFTFVGFTEQIDKAEFTTIQFGAHGKYMFPMKESPLSPYAVLGVGAFKTNYKEEGTDTPGGAYSIDAKGDTKVGGKLGLGGSWKANEMWGIGVEADYNFISMDKDKDGVSSLQYMGLNGVVTMHIPGASK